MADLILDQTHTPSAEEISTYIHGPGRARWNELNIFIQQHFGSTPKTTYSICSAKPGWNVKYQKSGKSLCTLYPERDGFVVLVVVKTALLAILEGMQAELGTNIMNIIRAAKPFNGTLWLMIPIKCDESLTGVKELLLLKVKG